MIAVWLLLAFVAYILAGYPLWLAWRARSKPWPVRKAWVPRTVSVMLAVRNGERHLAAKLESLLALDYPPELIEILVSSDGSADASEAIAREFAARDARIRWLHSPARGKWSALNAALEQASGEILFFTDVRQPLDPACLRELVCCYADPAVGCASGELVIRDGSTGQEVQTGLYWRYEKFIRRHQSAIDSVIGATGAVYTQRRELCRPLPPDTLLDDVHFPVQAFFAGYRVVFDGSAKAFDDPTRLDQEFRRKVRTLAGNYQLIGAFPALLGFRNRMLGHFLSHKFGRLVLPFALLGMLVSSLWYGPWWLVAGQLAGYGMAALDPAFPEGSPLKRLSSPARAFVVLMAASLSAASVLWRPAREFWK